MPNTNNILIGRVKLGRAFICLDCEVIYDQDEGLVCPQCTSKVVWPVGKWVTPTHTGLRKLIDEDPAFKI